MSESDNVIQLTEAGLLALGWMIGAKGDIHDPVLVCMARTLYKTGTKECTYVNYILSENPEKEFKTV